MHLVSPPQHEIRVNDTPLPEGLGVALNQRFVVNDDRLVEGSIYKSTWNWEWFLTRAIYRSGHVLLRYEPFLSITPDTVEVSDHEQGITWIYKQTYP